MRKILVCTAAAAGLLLPLAGCASDESDRPGRLPTAAQYAEADWYDPWRGVKPLYHGGHPPR